MLRRISAIEYMKAMDSGRTGPWLVTCETNDGAAIEVVAKCSAGCDQAVSSLAREVIAACLAGDLNLPIPEPFLVDFTPEWVQTLADQTNRDRAASSSAVAFGSHFVTGHSTWSSGNRISTTMLEKCAAIFVFDAIVQNVDRRCENPNCLVKGDEVRIFDHEATFTHGLVIGWKPPWELGGLKVLETAGFHIFREDLRGRAIDFAQIREAWSVLSDARLAEYADTVPAEWTDAGAAVQSALTLIGGARDNIDGCLAEVRRVLT